MDKNKNNNRVKNKKTKIIFVLIILILWCIHPTWTPKIKGSNSIAELKKIEINGTKQQVMIRGVDKNNPVIIFVHGGPGCPEIPYARKYEDLLEEKYVVVNYDHRGMGKSHSFTESYDEISVNILVNDLIQITDYVRKKFKVEKVILAGHSFGTIVGIKAASLAPEKYYAYIGIGQVGEFWKGELENLEYCLSKAIKQGNNKDIKNIENYKNLVKNKQESFPRKYTRKYGGSARLINENTDIINGVLFNKEYNILDGIRYIRGLSVTEEKLWNEVKNIQLSNDIRSLDIPCYFISGKNDYMTPIETAREYLNFISAPEKDFIVFDKSAHFPQFEEKEKFAEWLNQTCYRLGII